MSNFTDETYVPPRITYRPGMDPGAIGAGKFWVDASVEPPTVQVRNKANTGWDSVGATTGQEILGTSSTVVPTGSNGVQIAFTKTGGDTLLDLTTPTAPKVLTAGVYALTLQWAMQAAAGKVGVCDVIFGFEADNSFPLSESIPGSGFAISGVSTTAKVAANTSLTCQIVQTHSSNLLLILFSGALVKIA